jgi:hypothetical protein
MAPDFGTGLRAHLGLDAAQLELAAEPAAPPQRGPVAELVEVEVGEPPELGRLDALSALEAELVERERSLAAREALLASRAGSLLAAAQALYDEVVGGAAAHDDELARLRRRKSAVG